MSKSLDKLSKILAQAERAPEGSPERETFMEKALALSQAMSIDLAVARAHQVKKEIVEQPEVRQIEVGSFRRRYGNSWYVKLFLRIADANDIECTISGSDIWVFAHGFPSDIDVAERLFAMLSVQMVAEADGALKRGDNKEWVETQIYEIDNTYSWYGRGERRLKYDEDGHKVIKRVQRSIVDGRVWRNNFYEAFISRVGSRLWTARREARKAAGVDMSDESNATGLILRDKVKEVDEFYKKETEHRSMTSWKGASTSQSSGSAQMAGWHAAEKASLGDEHNVGGSSTKTLG
jgi:hypothetical protein